MSQAHYLIFLVSVYIGDGKATNIYGRTAAKKGGA